MSLRTPRDASFSTNLAAALAAISGGLAIWLSLQPERLSDLFRLVEWCGMWARGTHVYGPASDVDYPPWAIVLLSPLSLAPTAILPVLWVAANLACLVYVARALTRRLAMSGDRDDLSANELMFLLMAAGAMRTLNQFSLLSLALAVAGTRSAGTLRPLWLGLSLFKPQIGGVLWVYAVWQREWRLAGTALIVPVVLTGVYAAHAGVSLPSVPLEYAQSIALQYGGWFTGQTEITPWVRAVVPGVPAAVLALALAAVVFAPLSASRPLLGLALASLLSVRHLSYDLILLLPWVAGLSRRVVWALVPCFLLDPSALVRLIRPDSWLALHADRAFLFLGWMVAVWLSTRRHVSTGQEETQ
jgi:hypothetical protein